jgi:crotonobetainyl-CoA:carnitine CoA-transferase CaiB-like acyl-CoA transferase
MTEASLPLGGLRVVEVNLGLSDVGAGAAIGLPGSLLRDLGADVTRVEYARRSTLDTGVEFRGIWNRDKSVVQVDDNTAVPVIIALAEEADVLLIAGALDPRLNFDALTQLNPRLVYARIATSENADGPIEDYELLVHARAGVLTQINAHEKGRPAFGDLTIGSAGAGLSLTSGVLALLYEREGTGVGGAVESSLYEGVQALLPMIIGRVENHSPTTRLLWEQQGPAEALCYRCADGGYIQLWFGAKGAYEAFLEHIGDPPSEKGYNSDLASGEMVIRGARWAAKFATQPREYWLADLAGHDFRAEPAYWPGELLGDEQVRAIGLSIDEGGRTVLGSPVRVLSRGGSAASASAASQLLSGVHVLDLSAYLAGPVAPLVLAEFGADVLKVEPPTGDIHRAMEPMFAAGQRGKRAFALDLKSTEAPTVLSALFAWADVVHHNARVGLAERLGYDESTVRTSNPDAVYSFASGFGETGPKALLPTNDQLMQALAGIEAAQGGDGESPTYLVWGAVDVTGGWLAAIGILGGLIARRRVGGGQKVESSLLGAALTLKSGAYLRGSTVAAGPVLDGAQTGYGAAYRIYRGSDDAWLALAVPDAATWMRLGDVIAGLPAVPPALRLEHGVGSQPEELVLEAAFASKPAAEWVVTLRGRGVLAELVKQTDRTGFAEGFVTDAVNVARGGVATHQWGDRGRVDQPSFPPRFADHPTFGARPRLDSTIPTLGEHTEQVREALGL